MIGAAQWVQQPLQFVSSRTPQVRIDRLFLSSSVRYCTALIIAHAGSVRAGDVQPLLPSDSPAQHRACRRKSWARLQYDYFLVGNCMSKAFLPSRPIPFTLAAQLKKEKDHVGDIGEWKLSGY